MALLQNDKAIFYHPLDDSTESLKSQAWTVASGDLTGAGKISLALSGPVTDTISSFGSQATFKAVAGPGGIRTAKLTDTSFVVAYNDPTDSTKGSAKVGTVTGTSIAYGTESQFQTSVSADQMALAVLSATKFVVAWTNGSVDGFGRTKIGTVSGTTITFGAAHIFLGVPSANHTAIAVLSATSFVIAYQDFSVTQGRANVGTVSGTDITFGAQATFLAADVQLVNAVTLSATSVVVAYQEISNSHGHANVGTVSGTDLTFGAQSSFVSVGSALNLVLSAGAMSSTSFVVAYRDLSGGQRGSSHVGTVSGTTITFGALATFSSSLVQAVSVAVLSSTMFAVVYNESALGALGKANVGTVSGADITYGTQAEFQGVSQPLQMWATPLTASKFALAYMSTASSSNGVSKVGELASGANITASTPAAYDSAAAATKVAFCGWLKNPSA